METGKTYQPLVPCGRGARITDRRFCDVPVEEIRALLERYRWLAFTDNPVTVPEVRGHLGKLGELVENERRDQGVLKIDGAKKDEVLLGEGFMPLHKDGALMGTSVAMVAICCVRHREVRGGRTFITDIERAIEDVPSEVLDIIRERGIEAKPVDRYYLKASDQWYPIRGFIEVAGKSYLNTGFPYRPGEKASWLMRVPGVDEEKMQEMFDVMRAAMMDARYCYHHEWTEGDVLLLDNLRTLHGREAFEGDRHLANVQVIAP